MTARPANNNAVPGADLSGPYGANYAKLAQIKAKWDPGIVFHINQNIQRTN